MNDFQSKLNDFMQDSLSKWWNGMSKEDLIGFIASQPQITADYLRTMLENEGICINIGAAYNCAEKSTETTL